mmetsp:Transcript_10738/g.31755  ORF Transcript_10738/g.31755 Transcript_10738/m.31755 type:complete len:162 (+) Transcript_10738:103-588(+)
MAGGGSPQTPHAAAKRRPARAGKGAFAALDSEDSSSESDTPPLTAATRSPTESICSFSDNETDGDGWAVAAKPQKPQKPRREPLASQSDGAGAAETAAAPGLREELGDDGDDWGLRKGQRHGHSKLQKQEWSAKAQRRVGAARQKRVDQRGRQLAALAEDE